MGKRSNYQRRPRDNYPTPEAAVRPLLPHLPRKMTFIEPCVGDGRLVDHLYKLHPLDEDSDWLCSGWYDADPNKNRGVLYADARTVKFANLSPDCIFITNPPWLRSDLHQIIANLARQAPTWLLIDAPWMHTRQAAPHLACCYKIVSVGRVKWIEGSANSGMEDACWYLFDNRPGRGVVYEKPIFVPRQVENDQ